VVAALFGWLWWWILPARKRLAVRAYQRAFPGRDPRELAAGVGEVCRGYLDLLRGRYGRVEGAAAVAGGGLALAGHLSCWDLALVSGGRVAPVTIFVKPPSNRLAAALIRRLRTRADVELLPPTGSMAAAEAALDRGRLVIFVQDQRHNAGIAVDFFGQPARTSAAFAALVYRRRPRVFGITQGYEADGAFVVRVRPLEMEVPEPREAAILAITAASQAFYEGAIQARPWAWWWLHDRWKRAAS
jgi:KDO2-lipid IV(A) lauroyltransferase